jgi:hypothetical protein
VLLVGLVEGVAASSGEVPGFELSAETIEHAMDQNRITASGNVELTVGDLAATGERLEADLTAQQVRMVGPVIVRTPEGVLEGSDLDYRWTEGTGSLKAVHTSVQGIKIAGREVRLQTDGLVLSDGSLTGCTLEKPDYLIAGKTIEIDPKTKTVDLSGASLYLFGHKVLPLPHLRFSLADSEAGRLSRSRLPMPATGYDSARGYYLSDEFPVLLSEQGILLLGAGYGSQERGRLTAGGLYSLSPATTLDFNARFIQSDAVSGQADLDGVVRLEARTFGGKMELSYEDRDDDDGKDLIFRPSLTFTPAPVSFGLLKLEPSIGGALVEEKATGQKTSRLATSMAWSTPAFGLAGGKVTLNGTTEWAAYGTGQARLTGATNAGWARPVTSDLPFLANYASVQQAGATPFLYDRPERIYREGAVGLAVGPEDRRLALSAVYDLETGLRRLQAVKGSLSVDSPNWEVAGDVRYELTEQRYSEATLALTRHLHCFDVELKYDPVEQKTSFGVELR